jgi:hypothetical protein
LQRELRGHHKSLCEPQAPARSDGACACLHGPSQKTAILPGSALVKRPLRRKS